MLNLLGVALGIICFLVSIDRLRHLNWFKSKCAYVGMYVLCAIWSLFVVKEAWVETIAWYQLCGLGFAICMFYASKDRWMTPGAPTNTNRGTVN